MSRCRLLARTLRHTTIATACLATLAGSVPALADSSITVSVNIWTGAAGTDWFDQGNWWFGPLFGLPDPRMPVFIGPVQRLANGIPTNTFDLPAGEAVLGGSFSTSSLTMTAWDGTTQLRLTPGGTLTTSATIGGLNAAYQASGLAGGAPRPATLVLDGGNFVGSLNFLAHSRLEVTRQYAALNASMSGTLDELVLANGAALNLSSSSLSIARVSNAGALSLGGGRNFTVTSQFDNNGIFTLNGSGSTGTAALYVNGATTLSGAGSTVLTNADYSYIGGSAALTVASGHTLRGAGYVATSLVNKGSVIADGVLTVNAGSNNSFDNTAGTVQVADGARLALSSGTFSGGTLQGLGANSRLSGNGSFQSVALAGDLLLTGSTTLQDVTNTGNLRLSGVASVNLRGNLANNGSFTVQGSGATGSASVYVTAATTLSGTGSTVLANADYSYIGGSAALTVASGHTLRGAGYVATSLVNKGSVIADGVLTVNAGSNNSFDNTAGTVQVADGARLALSSGTFSGGTLQGLGANSRLSGNGSFQSVALAGDLLLTGSTTLQDVTNTGNLRLSGVASVNLRGNLANNGSFTVQGSGATGSASVYVTAATTLSGTGSTVLANADYSYIGGSAALTVASGHTLRGAGYVATSLVNNGSVIADGVLTVNAGSNNSFDNTAGTVQVADGARLALSSGTFSGGTLQGLGANSRLSGNGSFQSVALAGDLLLTGSTTLQDVTNTGNLRLSGVASVNLRGNLANNGSFTVQGSGTTGSASVYVTAATTLSGTGSTVLTNADYSYIGGSAALTVASGHTLRGAGYVATSLVNNGSVIADGVLTVNAGSNNSFDNTAGLVQVGNSGRLQLSGGRLSGGTLQGLGTGSRIQGAGTFQDLALAGQLLVAGGSSANMAGTIANGGTLTLAGSGSTGSAAVYLTSAATLAGTGGTVLTDANYSNIGGSGLLTIGAEHTLRGAGYVTTSVANQGSVMATGVLSVNAGSGSNFTNSGRLQVDAGAQLLDASNQAGIVQNGANATTVVNGLLKAPTLTLNAGSLQGSGTVQANVLNLGGTINAGNSPGKLSITGNLTLGDDSLLLVEVAGPVRGTQYDWLAVSGNVVLDGDLRLVFTGYTPQVGEQFAFLTSGGSFSGRFDNAWANGWSLDLQYGAQGVTATVTAVPEPGSWALLLLGSVGLGAWLRRRQATSS